MSPPTVTEVTRESAADASDFPRCMPLNGVGAVRQKRAFHSTLDQERERHIADCRYLMEQAYAAGNGQEARRWLELMNQAIKDRSPEMVKRMERERGLS